MCLIQFFGSKMKYFLELAGLNPEEHHFWSVVNYIDKLCM